MILEEELELLDWSELCDIAIELGFGVTINYSKQDLIDMIIDSDVSDEEILLMIEIYSPL